MLSLELKHVHSNVSPNAQLLKNGRLTLVAIISVAQQIVIGVFMLLSGNYVMCDVAVGVDRRLPSYVQGVAGV